MTSALDDDGAAPAALDALLARRFADLLAMARGAFALGATPGAIALVVVGPGFVGYADFVRAWPADKVLALDADGFATAMPLDSARVLLHAFGLRAAAARLDAPAGTDRIWVVALGAHGADPYSAATATLWHGPVPAPGNGVSTADAQAPRCGAREARYERAQTVGPRGGVRWSVVAVCIDCGEPGAPQAAPARKGRSDYGARLAALADLRARVCPRPLVLDAASDLLDGLARCLRPWTAGKAPLAWVIRHGVGPGRLAPAVAAAWDAARSGVAMGEALSLLEPGEASTRHGEAHWLPGGAARCTFRLGGSLTATLTGADAEVARAARRLLAGDAVARLVTAAVEAQVFGGALGPP